MSNTTGKKSVLVSYLERNKRIEIPRDKPRGMTDVQYIESVFKSVFSFDRNVKLCITFQRFDTDWNEFVDLELGDDINHKDILKVVVSPLLNNFETSSVSVSAITPSPSDIVSPCLSDIEVLLNQACDDQDHNELPPGLPPKRNGKRPSVVIHSDSDDSGSEEKMSQFCKPDGPGDQKRVKNENNCSGTSKTLYCDEKLSVSNEVN